MRGLIAATFALCVAASVADTDESMDVYWYKSQWQGQKPEIDLYIQGTSTLETMCKSATCSVLVSYREVESSASEDLEAAPEFQTKTITFNTWKDKNGRVDLEGLEGGSLYQVRIQPKVGDKLGPVREFFIRTVTMENESPITKYKRGYQKRGMAAENSQLLKLLLAKLLEQ